MPERARRRADPPGAASRERWITPRWPAPAHVRACSTTREGGCSAGPYASFNLASHVGDDAGAVAANRARLRETLDLPGEPCWLRQVHGRTVAAADPGAPGIPWSPGCAADACTATTTGRVCAILTADCIPLLLCDRAGTRVGAAHAGWRGLAGGVVEASVAAMSAAPEDLLAWLGPGIGPRRFEVGEEVRTALIGAGDDAAAFCAAPGGRWLADLYRLARLRLARCGVQAVAGGQWCTAGEPARFYSYRREGVTGRMATLIWMAQR